MTTVAQMIEWMQTLPPAAEVQCGAELIKGHVTYMVMKPVDIECCHVYDYTSSIYCKEHYPTVAGKAFVNICAE